MKFSAILALAFVILLFLIIVVYYTGSVNTMASFTTATRHTIYWLTGRDNNGNFITAS